MIPGNPPSATETSLDRIARAVRMLFEGGVGGPSPAGAVTDNAVMRWDGTDGRTAQNSTVTIDDTGVLLVANQPGFSATKSGSPGGDQTGITSGVFTKITFNTEEYDIGGYFDSVTNFKWTPPTGVKVLITAGARMTAGVVDQAIFVLTVYKNGARYRDLGVQTISDGGGGNTPAVIGAILDTSDGTGYEIYMTSTGAGNKTISGSTIATFFQGEILR